MPTHILLPVCLRNANRRLSGVVSTAHVETLQSLVTHFARIQRSGETFETPACELVPRYRVLLESGERIPAHPRLSAHQDSDFVDTFRKFSNRA